MLSVVVCPLSLSQYLHYIGLGVLPTRDEAAQCSVLKTDQLPHIINPIEAYLGNILDQQKTLRHTNCDAAISIQYYSVLYKGQPLGQCPS